MPLNKPYLDLIHQSLPRLLALYDTDASCETYGMGDRYHWAWGLIDFTNGTFQGAAHGLARLLDSGLLPESMSEASILMRIDALFIGASQARRKDGSLEEAFPFEGSYCVTALVAYDLLSAVELLVEHTSKSKQSDWLEEIKPMIAYLRKAEETHALISNHLATAVAALIKWQQLTAQDVEEEAIKVLDIILANQSAEGWFNEYGGADPGYQTLCTYYLADVHRMRPDLALIEPLRRSIQFLWHFAHPDGSFGGLYGSRNTRFYYPAGLEYLAAEIPEAAALASFMRKSIRRQTVVNLAAMDEPNLIPMFNAYCWAATCCDDNQALMTLPQHSPVFRKHWADAGILVDRGVQHYSIISTHKGGVCYHFAAGQAALVNAGILAKDKRGVVSSSQSYQSDNLVELDADKLKITSAMRPVTRRRSTPSQFIVLRMLNLTLMRSMWIREKVKQLLVKLLISGGNQTTGSLRRTINLGESLAVDDELDAPALEQIQNIDNFVAIHMASQGYWQMQDDAGK